MTTIQHLDLLREAWPEGLVARRGVVTMAGWQCVSVGAGLSDWLSQSGALHSAAHGIASWPAASLAHTVDNSFLPALALFDTDVVQQAALTAELASLACPECPGFHPRFVFTATDAFGHFWTLYHVTGWASQYACVKRWTSSNMAFDDGFPKKGVTDGGVALARCMVQLRRAAGKQN